MEKKEKGLMDFTVLEVIRAAYTRFWPKEKPKMASGTVDKPCPHCWMSEAKAKEMEAKLRRELLDLEHNYLQRKIEEDLDPRASVGSTAREEEHLKAQDRARRDWMLAVREYEERAPF